MRKESINEQACKRATEWCAYNLERIGQCQQSGGVGRKMALQFTGAHSFHVERIAQLRLVAMNEM
jgi:hypothetical protein